MPIYAYKCESCGFAKDVLQKMSDAQLTDCPHCGATSFKKQLTAAGFQLKGSGWYVTDFRGENAAAKAADGTAAPPVAVKPADGAAASPAAPVSPSGGSTPSAAPAPAPAPVSSVSGVSSSGSSSKAAKAP